MVVNNENVEIIERYINQFCCENCMKNLNEGALQCKCAETKLIDWRWEFRRDVPVHISEDNTRVVFFPVYSCGTACLKGTKPFKQNLHYYWELKILTGLYGTDVMVGVGTEKKNLNDFRNRFCSALGCDGQSWGYSYNGYLLHNRRSHLYAPRFSIGTLVGVHLDMCSGQLEYYINRKPLGIAFKNLKSHKLYPMISSTAAKSGMKMTCSVSCNDTLQLKCLQVISQHPELCMQYKNTPGLVQIFKNKYFWLYANNQPDEVEPKEELCKHSYIELVETKRSVPNHFPAVRY